MAATQLSTNAEFIQVNTQANPGTILLPSAASVAGRIVVFKDTTGSFSVNPLTISTNLGNTFEDGGNRKILTERFGFYRLASDGASRWYLLDGTQMPSYTISTINTTAGLNSLSLSTQQLNVSSITFRNMAQNNVSTLFSMSTLLYYGNQVVGGTRAGPTIFLPLKTTFTPLSYSGLIIWFDAADTSTITTAGTTVTRWLNKGTSAASVATNTVASPLTQAPGTVSSGNIGYTKFLTSHLNVVYFPGQTYLAVPNVTTTQKNRTQAYIFSVLSYGDGYASIFRAADTTGTNQAGFNAWNRDGNSIVMFTAGFGGTEQLALSGPSSGTAYNGTLPFNGLPFIVVWRHTTSTATNTIRINGTPATLTVNQALVNGYFTGTTNFALGTGPFYSNGQIIGELLQYDGALTDAQLQGIEGYLAWKWNMMSYLPAAHPFKNIPP